MRCSEALAGGQCGSGAFARAPVAMDSLAPARSLLRRMDASGR
jgi:hypothetical protein